MYQYLSTEFSDEEVATIREYCYKYEVELSLLFGISKELFSEEGVNPNRIILVGGYYLMEEKGEEGMWYMGQYCDNKYVFWSRCRSLKDAINSL